MTIWIYSNGCPTCGKTKAAVARAQRVLSRAFHTVVVYNNKYDRKAREEHRELLQTYFGIRDHYETVMKGENGTVMILRSDMTEEEIYGILQ